MGPHNWDQDNWSPTFSLDIEIQCAAQRGAHMSELATQSG